MCKSSGFPGKVVLGCPRRVREGRRALRVPGDNTGAQLPGTERQGRLCGHHYRVSRPGLAAAGAMVLCLRGKAAVADRSPRCHWPSSRGKRRPRWDLSPSPGKHLPLSTQRVFVGDEVSLDVSLAAAGARLASLVRSGLLGRASAQAYGDGITGLGPADPLGPVPGLSRLVRVHVQNLEVSGDSARFALRWEVTGPGGELFPALDADITLTPAGEHATTLTLIGAYRPHPGTAGAALDRAIMHRTATATIRAFLYRIAESIAYPAGADQR